MNCAKGLALAFCTALGVIVTLATAHAESTVPVQVQEESTAPEFEAARGDFDIAVAALDAGDYEAALPLWRKLQARVPRAATPHANLALIEMRLGHLEAAEANMRAAIVRQPSAAFYNQLGLIQRQRGEFAAARASYEQALSLDEGFARAHLNLAILCDLYLQEWPVAMEHYRRYHALSGEGEHKQLAIWIGDLERRMQVTP